MSLLQRKKLNQHAELKSHQNFDPVVSDDQQRLMFHSRVTSASYWVETAGGAGWRNSGYFKNFILKMFSDIFMCKTKENMMQQQPAAAAELWCLVHQVSSDRPKKTTTIMTAAFIQSGLPAGQKLTDLMSQFSPGLITNSEPDIMS